MQSQKLFEIESASRENDLALRELTLKEKVMVRLTEYLYE